MAYVRLTTLCNMRCAHCGFACHSKGSFMPREVFLAACQLASDRGDSVFLGGGEPTLHPLLFDFIGIALAYDDPYNGLGIGLVTNGKRDKEAIRLAEMAKRGILSVDLSQSPWHEEISERVVEAFTREEKSYGRDENDKRGIRGERLTTDNLVNAGRARKLLRESGYEGKRECFCDDLIVQPDGRIFQCGCMKRQFGTVFVPEIPETYEPQSCSERRG